MRRWQIVKLIIPKDPPVIRHPLAILCLLAAQEQDQGCILFFLNYTNNLLNKFI
jgi:hypothetical protein